MKSDNRFIWIVLALCLFSFARGVYGLGDQSLWWDESLSHYRATKPFSFIFTNRINIRSGDGEFSTIDNHPPLYFVLLRLVILAAGDTEFSLRFISVVAGVLIVPLLYLCGTRLFDPLCGLLASLLGAFSPLYLWYQQEVRPYTLVTLFALLTFYTLVRVLEMGDHSRWVRVRYGLAYVFAIAAMLSTHYLSFLLLAAEGGILIMSWLGNRRRFSWFLVISVGLVAVVLFAWVLPAIPRQANVSGYDFLPLHTLLRDVFHAFALGLSADVLVFFRWWSIVLFGIATGILFAYRKNIHWQRPAWLLVCLLLPILGMFMLSWVRPAYLGVRHLIFSSPFYYLLLAGGVGKLYRARPQVPARVLAGIGLAGVIVSMVWSTQAYLTDPQYAKEDHRGWGQYLSEHVRADDFVAVVPAPVFELYSYYVDTDALSVELPFLGHSLAEAEARLATALQEHDRVWVAFSSTPGWANPGNVPIKWLEKHAIRTHFVQFNSPSTVVQVLAFRARLPVLDELPDVTWNPPLNFDDQVHLLGVNSPSTFVESGHTLQLSLYWAAAQSLDRNYRVTLSLTDRDGFSWTAIDHIPCDGGCPTTRWPASRIIQDDVDLTLPPGVPPGQYRIHISVYPQNGGGPALAARSLQDGQLQGLIVPVGSINVISPAQRVDEDTLPIPIKTNHRYGDITLIGHTFGGGNYRPGDVLKVGLYWKARRQPRQDALFALLLVGEDGQIWAERDVNVSDTYPPSQWKKGDVIWEQYRFRVPVTVPQGEYAFYLVSKDAGMRRWPWDDGREALGILAVKPVGDDLVFQVPSMDSTLYANLDDKIELLGYDLEGVSVHPGEVVSCTLYWRALQEISQNYTVFNHLVAADGQTWGQWDNQPQKGGLPTTRWVPGQVVADPYQIPVSADAPAGPLQLQTGMYDALTMTRLAVRDENGHVIGDHVPLVEIDVVDK
ncbi:MAG: glycosyltransferase family 39 protein [Anaerolineae bacterium]|nr:glycosyltransferase family 39 protein [Anaerolineae bacterium]